MTYDKLRSVTHGVCLSNLSAIDRRCFKVERAESKSTL